MNSWLIVVFLFSFGSFSVAAQKAKQVKSPVKCVPSKKNNCKTYKRTTKAASKPVQAQAPTPMPVPDEEINSGFNDSVGLDLSEPDTDSQPSDFYNTIPNEIESQ